MELVIKDIKSSADIKLFTDLAKKLGLKTARLTAEEKEDIGLAEAIRKTPKKDYVSTEKIMERLKKIKDA